MLRAARPTQGNGPAPAESKTSPGAALAFPPGRPATKAPQRCTPPTETSTVTWPAASGPLRKRRPGTHLRR
jgi:hypothetical protein